jgi:hypothetical protein
LNAIARYSLQIMPFVTLFASVAIVAVARRAWPAGRRV